MRLSGSVLQILHGGFSVMPAEKVFLSLADICESV